MKNELNGRFVASISPPRQEGEPYRGWKYCIEWCQDHFGYIDRSWSYVGEGVFEFRDEQEYLTFMLKWS